MYILNLSQSKGLGEGLMYMENKICHTVPQKCDHLSLHISVSHHLPVTFHYEFSSCTSTSEEMKN